MKKKILIGFLLVVGISTGFALTTKDTQAKEETKYTAVKAKTTEFKKIIESDGVVNPKDSKLIYVDRSLKVKNLDVKEGDFVKKGDVIIRFDEEDKNKISRNLEKEKLSLKKLERDLINSKKLLEVGGSSKVEVEDLELDIAKMRLNIEDYKEELEKMVDEIESPFNGTIISLVAEENYRVNTEKELLEIADLSDLIITAEVPEYSIKDIKVGQEVDIKPNAFDRTLKGTVSSISTLSNANTTEATVEVEVVIQSEHSDLRPGFNVSLEFVVDSKNSITIPRNSLLEEGDKYFVYLINEETNKVFVQYIDMNSSNSDEISVEGLNNGDLLLANPNQEIFDGKEISYTERTSNSPERSTERPEKRRNNG